MIHPEQTNVSMHEEQTSGSLLTSSSLLARLLAFFLILVLTTSSAPRSLLPALRTLASSTGSSLPFLAPLPFPGCTVPLLPLVLVPFVL